MIRGSITFALVLTSALTSAAIAEVPATPLSLPGATTHVYRQSQTQPVRLHVFPPDGPPSPTPRPCLLVFFGGGWWRGLPSAHWPAWAARHGFVGVAADYRTLERFGADARDSVADARLALRWVHTHAEKLHIDPKRVAVLGVSAGAHLALWTALESPPPDLAADEAPLFPPVALVLLSPVTDTSHATGFRPERFGREADAFSPVHRPLDALPPLLVFHGTADDVVPFAQTERFVARLHAVGRRCDFVPVPLAGHDTRRDPREAARIDKRIAAFLHAHAVLDK